jgi:Tol biopolymer transport system component
MKLIVLAFLCAVCICLKCFSQKSAKVSLSPAIPVLVTERIVNTSMNERDIAISPDGMEMFYTVLLQPTLFHTILYCKKDKNGQWSAHRVASFSGCYSDMEPAFSADGQKLFFSSNRPYDSSKTKNYDIWYVERVNGLWTDPKNPGASLNTSANEFYPSVAANGNLYLMPLTRKVLERKIFMYASGKMENIWKV